MFQCNPQAAGSEPTYYYSNINEIGGGDGVWDMDLRWPEVEKFADLRQDDTVLDIGCAEGLIAMEVAARVSHVHGIEIQSARIEAAEKIADERGIRNISFECAAVGNYEIQPKSYDVILFLGVLQHLPREEKYPSLIKVLQGARRQVIMRMPLFDPRSPNRTTNIARACQQTNFALTIYPRHEPKGGNLLIANRFNVPEQ